MTEPLSHGQGSHQGPAQISPGLLHENHHNCRCRRLRHTKELLINLITRPEYDSLSLFLSLCVHESLKSSLMMLIHTHQSSSTSLALSSHCVHPSIAPSILNVHGAQICGGSGHLREREREILHLEWVIVSAVQEFIGLGHPY